MIRPAPWVGAGHRGRGGEAGACTESLGSESGDVGCDAAEIDQFFPPAPAAGGPDDAGAEPCIPDLAAAAAAGKRRRGPTQSGERSKKGQATPLVRRYLIPILPHPVPPAPPAAPRETFRVTHASGIQLHTLPKRPEACPDPRVIGGLSA